MKMIAAAAVLGAILMPMSAAAQGAPRAKESMLVTWFKHLKEGLSESTVSGRYQHARVTAVAAVRGAQQDAAEPDKPAWKGSGTSKKALRLKKEKAEFAQAVDLILAGKIQDGTAALDAFEKAHPKSPLLPDVQQAREKAKELASSSGAAAGASEAPEASAAPAAAPEPAKTP